MSHHILGFNSVLSRSDELGGKTFMFLSHSRSFDNYAQYLCPFVPAAQSETLEPKMGSVLAAAYRVHVAV